MARYSNFSLLTAAAAALAGCGMTPEEQVQRAEKDFAAHQFTSARLDLISALQEQPSNRRAAELLARTQLELGDGEAAAALLDRLAASGSLPADGAILRGEADLLRGRIREALDHVADEATPEAWRVRALAYIELRDITAAADAFAKGATAGGPKARLLAESARFALAQGDRATARRSSNAGRRGSPGGSASYGSSCRCGRTPGGCFGGL
jgi:Tfp pilus assembly protein PilF